MSPIKRRRFLSWLLGAFAGTIWYSRSWSSNQTAFLKDYAAQNNLLYGAATQYSILRKDKDFTRRFVEECAILVPENDFKWKNLRPTPESFDFTKTDWLESFAQAHNLKLRGHTLVWHKSLPDWFRKEVNPTNAAEYLVNHITTVVQRYKGKIHSWDVINEAIHIKDRQDDGLRNTLWLKYLGAEYIELAFKTAAAADPHALLTYNDFDLAYDTPAQEAKRNATLKLLEKLKAKNTPIQALGMQGHLNAGSKPLNARKLQRFMQNVADLGLKILVSELDVADRTLETATVIRDRAVADVYRQYLEIVLTQPAVIGVITWGLSDRYTWLKKHRPRKDGENVRPLPLDEALKPKLVWEALAEAFKYH